MSCTRTDGGKACTQIRLAVFLIIALLIACGGSGGSDAPGSPSIVGAWQGECREQHMVLEYENDDDFYVSDDLGGWSYGTFTYEDEKLCMDILFTNKEGCTSPELGTLCSDVVHDGQKIVFLDFNPGTGNAEFIKMGSQQPSVSGTWTGNLLFVWVDGTSNEDSVTLELYQNGNEVTGIFLTPDGSLNIDGRVVNDLLSFNYRLPCGSGGDVMTASLNFRVEYDALAVVSGSKLACSRDHASISGRLMQAP